MPDGDSTVRAVELPRFLLFSPWTLVPASGIALSLAALYAGFWGFLGAIHPTALGVIAVVITLWLLYALSPKLTVQLMRILDVKLPRGDSGVPFLGMAVRMSTVLLGPLAIYLSLMALREETSPTADVTGAVVLGLVLGLLCWRSWTLLLIMRETFPEDEIRKGVLDTGVYDDVAIAKLKEATQEVRAEGNLDKKRIRLRRLAATDRVLRNRNYDPHRIQESTATSATVGGIEREREVAWATRNLEQIDLHSDLGDEELRARIAERQARRRHFDSQSQPRRSRHGRSLEEELREKLDDKVGLHEAGDRVLESKRAEMTKAGLPPEEIERRMSLLEAELAEIIARLMSEE